MPGGQITIEPEGSDFYRPTERQRRGGLPSLVIKLFGGRINEESANLILLVFAIIVFIISIIILATAL